MNRRILFILLLMAATLSVTAMGRKAPKSPPPSIDSMTAQAGISGRVEIWEGNFMPMVSPSKANGKILPGSGLRVRVYEPVTMAGGLASAQRDSVPAMLIAETICDSSGHFSVAAKPGTYSVFVERNGGWYANSWSGTGVQGQVVVLPYKNGEILIKITDKATF
jgi:hypothetical protein